MAWTHQGCRGNGVFTVIIIFTVQRCLAAPEPVPVKSPIYHVGIDFVGPFTGCHNYILTI